MEETPSHALYIEQSQRGSQVTEDALKKAEGEAAEGMRRALENIRDNTGRPWPNEGPNRFYREVIHEVCKDALAKAKGE